MNTSKKLYILEGCDGSGKSTVANALAARFNVHLVHMGPLLKVNSLARLYVEAMLPAILGDRDVVMDRCWLSEPIYGTHYRDGVHRLTRAQTRMLERLAMRCAAQVIVCDPSWPVCLTNYRKRKGEEYVQNEEILHAIHNDYRKLPVVTELPYLKYDYRQWERAEQFVGTLEDTGAVHHPTNALSAGWWCKEGTPHKLRSILLVGEKFTEHGAHDPLYQWPFGSLSGGCSTWLTEQLAEAGISEYDLLWANADDMGLEQVVQAPLKGIWAMGDVAEKRLQQLGVKFGRVEHPQFWKRFKANGPYPLIESLKEQINGR